MTKKRRLVLFLTLLIAFLIITPGIIFYSLGYRFDFENKKITQTGGFYFKVFPKRVTIYINPLSQKGGKKQKPITKNTDFFFGTAYIENLLPKKYEVEIKKEGYHRWKKILEIKEKEVTDAKNIILVPKNPSLLPIQKSISDFFVSPEKEKMILKQNNKDYWELKLLNLKTKIKSHIIASPDLSRNKIELLSLNFSPNGEMVLLKTKTKENEIKYYSLDLKKNPPKLISLEFLGKKIKKIIFHPKEKEKLFFLKEGMLFEANMKTKEISGPFVKNIYSLGILNDGLYYLQSINNRSFSLFKTDLSFSRKEEINETPLSLKKDQDYRLYLFSGLLFLQDNKNLYWFNPQSKNLEIFFETGKKPKISPDLKKLLYFSEHEIWIYFLNKELSQPMRSQGERIFIARFSNRIQNAFWLTSHYLIFNVGDKIKIAEIDDRDGLNVVDFITKKEGKIFWQNSLGELYILENNLLYSSKIPLP